MGGNNKVNSKQLESFLSSVNWYPQGAEGKPIYTLLPTLVAIKGMSSKFKVDYKLIAIHVRYGHISWFFDEYQLLKMSKIFLRRYLKNKAYIQKLYNEWQKEITKFYIFIDEINNKNYDNLNNKELLKLFKILCDKFSMVWKYFIFIDCFDPHGDELLKKYMKQYKIEIFPDDLKILLSSDKPTFVINEKLKFLEIAKFFLKNRKSYEKIDQLIKEHQKKYYWHMNNYGHIKYLTVNDFYKKLNEAIKTLKLKEIEKEIVNIKVTFNNNAKEKQKIIKKYDIPQNLLSIFQLFSMLTEYRDLRKKMNLIGVTAMRYVLYKISKRLDIDVGTLEYLGHWEVKNVFKLTRKELLEIRDRKENSFWIFKGKKEMLFFKLDEAQKWKEFIDKLIIKEFEELRGIGASNGIVKGKVKIITLVKEFDKMQKGNVLVTQMTRPEFTPILKKASAIVTDEGGLTCHAAIVARELKIPCIIGTKIATKVLKDDMLVEVNAIIGTVKILKKC